MCSQPQVWGGWIASTQQQPGLCLTLEAGPMITAAITIDTARGWWYLGYARCQLDTVHCSPQGGQGV